MTVWGMGCEVDVVEARFGDPAHREAIVAILDSYARDAMGGGEPLRDDVRANLVDALARQPNALVLLALAEAAPVGLAVCFFGFSTFQARPLLNVHDLAVLPAHRGRRIGEALLAAAEARARARGCCKLTLEVLDRNARARTLYARRGFADVAVADSTFTRFLSKSLGAGPEPV